MRTFLNFLAVILLPFVAPVLSADQPPSSVTIVLSNEQTNKKIRSLCDVPIDSYYCVTLSGLYTEVTQDMGLVEVTVSNITSGEFWHYSFNSGRETSSFLQLPVGSGYYEVRYITESGEVYRGVFVMG